jgi:hypothetical protein
MPVRSPRSIVGLALLATTSIVVGVIWDISWHRSIGRDTFWTPAHLAIYAGGLIAGLSGGVVVLRTTFGGPGPAVRVWGFRGPLGAWVGIWGALAMLASAPFDDWWHNTYGLDVTILSPPHTVLALGIIAIQIGMWLTILSHQNRASYSRWLDVAFSYAGGALILQVGTMFLVQTLARKQHSSSFYVVSAAVFPLFLVAASRASKGRWGATLTAAVFMGISVAMTWILPLFPAEPKLAPILNPLTHMVPPPFPLLLVIPAATMDVWMRRIRGREWMLALLLGSSFVLVLLAVQWWFSEFMLSPRSASWFFGGHRWSYSVSPDDPRLNRFSDEHLTMRGLAFAILVAAVVSRIGLGWGTWMRKVVR